MCSCVVIRSTTCSHHERVYHQCVAVWLADERMLVLSRPYPPALDPVCACVLCVCFTSAPLVIASSKVSDLFTHITQCPNAHDSVTQTPPNAPDGLAHISVSEFHPHALCSLCTITVTVTHMQTQGSGRFCTHALWSLCHHHRHSHADARQWTVLNSRTMFAMPPSPSLTRRRKAVDGSELTHCVRYATITVTDPQMFATPPSPSLTCRHRAADGSYGARTESRTSERLVSFDACAPWASPAGRLSGCAPTTLRLTWKCCLHACLGGSLQSHCLFIFRTTTLPTSHW
jgi:hypothetical protein